jgi:hypothetical protein
MSGSPREDWPRVQVHPGTGLVARHGDTLLVVPVLPAAARQRVRELLDLCSHVDPAGQSRVSALRALLDLRPPGELPGFALLIRTGQSLRALVSGPVQLLLDGAAPALPAGGASGRLTEHRIEDGAWRGLAVLAEGGTAVPDDADVLPLDLGSGAVPGAGVTLHRVPAGRAQQLPAEETGPPAEAPAATGLTRTATTLRPAVRFRTVLLGECAVRAPAGRPVPERRPPLPVAGAGGGATGPATRGPEDLVEGVHCPAGHFTDPDATTCLTCGIPLPADGDRVRLPRPPLGVLVTDGGTIYTVTGDLVIGREPEQSPDVLAGRARPLPLRDSARSTSRVHARLTVDGWKVLLSDNASANGTFVSGSGAAGPWLPVAPQTSIRLVHGDRLRLGARQLFFDTWREAVRPQVFR